MTDLYKAAKVGNLAKVRTLLERGDAIDAPAGHFGDTALMIAAHRGYTDIVALLLERGADPNARTRDEVQYQAGDRYTALMYAAEMGHPETVSLLLQCGSDPDAALGDGVTAAGLAANDGYDLVVGLFRAADADIVEPGPVSRQAVWPDTPLHRAVRRFQIGWEVAQSQKTGFAFRTRNAREVADIGPRLQAIEWFARCSTPPPSTVGQSRVRAVSSWKEAKYLSSSRIWENTQLEGQNSLSLYLSKHANTDFQSQWNPTADAACSFVHGAIYPALMERLTGDVAWLDVGGRFDHFARDVWSDVLGATMLHAWRVFDPPGQFQNELLSVYEAGHFPCGWEGAKWPNGTFLVW